jgi:hypothetical protein
MISVGLMQELSMLAWFVFAGAPAVVSADVQAASSPTSSVAVAPVRIVVFMNVSLALLCC